MESEALAIRYTIKVAILGGMRAIGIARVRTEITRILSQVDRNSSTFLGIILLHDKNLGCPRIGVEEATVHSQQVALGTRTKE